MEMMNDRILTQDEITAAKELQEVLEPLTDAQRQRVIGFAACLRTVDAVAVPQMHVLRKSGAAAV